MLRILRATVDDCQRRGRAGPPGDDDVLKLGATSGGPGTRDVVNQLGLFVLGLVPAGM